MSEALRAELQCEVVCLDLNAESVRSAQARGFEARQVDLDLEAINGEGFDVVIFADVLEHLRRPEETLRQVSAAKSAVVSWPNIAHWSARWELLAGRFPRDPHGLFDRTHLQFLTRATMHQVASDGGWQVVREQCKGSNLPLQKHIRGLHRLSEMAARWRPELFAVQIIMTLERGPSK